MENLPNSRGTLCQARGKTLRNVSRHLCRILFLGGKEKRSGYLLTRPPATVSPQLTRGVGHGI